MIENLTRFESERQRQERRATEQIKRAKQDERNRVEWCKRMHKAALAGDYDVARHILDTQFPWPPNHCPLAGWHNVRG